MAAVSGVRARKHKVFRSIFQVDVAQPTPSIPSTQFGEPFGGPSAQLSPDLAVPQHQSDQVRWDRAWHVVTGRILLPSSVAVEDSFGILVPESQDLDVAFYDALAVVLDPQATVPRATHTEDVLQWHAQQVRQHFVHHVLPLLAACASQEAYGQVLVSSIQTLEAAHRQYLYCLRLIVRGIDDEATAGAAVARFRRDLHAIIGSSWAKGLSDALRHVLRRRIDVILGIRRRSSAPSVDGSPAKDSKVTAVREELLGLVESLQTVGLAGEKFQVLFAEVMDSCMESFIQEKYSGVWNASQNAASQSPGPNSSSCLDELGHWVENQYSRLAVEVFSRVGGHVTWNDVERWKAIAVGRLATLRIRELFDIVLQWPESKGGLEDLRSSVTTPQRRLQLTDTFSTALQKRLLHPGRSTLDILQTYISMIRTFHVLDHSKVLLDRVVHALQLYLCQRDDAIRTVVTGLLANPAKFDMEESKTKLIELAVILNDASQHQRRQLDDEELDWNDMSWVPDPVDAGVNYKRPKNEDVIGTLINALGSQDIFIKEFQLIIAERLLSSQAGFQQESKVLSLLKRRFGESSLQNCDVMMKDIQDSKKVDAILCKSVKAPVQPGAPNPSYHSKILSRLFWPNLPKEPFEVPLPIAKFQQLYEQGFEQLKTSRKLTWLDHLGTATVALELEDRSIEVECKTYEASVIYAFQSEFESEDGPQQRTFDDLWAKLMIDEDLLEQALKFWTSRKVLRDIGDRTYVVVEKLDDKGDSGEVDDVTQGLGGAETGRHSPRKPKAVDSKEQERRGVYWQFIVGMLTNSSPTMPLGQILMMMKMLIPDGCPWSNEELQEFLGEKIGDNELELVGGKYRLPKK